MGGVCPLLRMMDIEDLGEDIDDLGIVEESKEAAYTDQETLRFARSRKGLNVPPSHREPQLEILELKVFLFVWPAADRPDGCLVLQDDFIKFVLSKTDYSMANALRRIMIAEVPTMAIDMVEIRENSRSELQSISQEEADLQSVLFFRSVLIDDFLAHRLGLVPLVSTTAHNFQFQQVFPARVLAEVVHQLRFLTVCAGLRLRRRV